MSRDQIIRRLRNDGFITYNSFPDHAWKLLIKELDYANVIFKVSRLHSGIGTHSTPLFHKLTEEINKSK
jgi:hypothetical protein